MSNIKLISWIPRGSQRRVIFPLIKDRVIPAQIYQEAVKENPKVTRNSVSDALREFRNKKLVLCVNPVEKKGRIYKLTSFGKKIQEQLK